MEEFEQRFQRINEIMDKTLLKRRVLLWALLFPVVGLVLFLLSVTRPRFLVGFPFNMSILAAFIVVGLILMIVLDKLSKNSASRALNAVLNEFNPIDNPRGLYWRFHVAPGTLGPFRMYELNKHVLQLDVI